MSFLEPQIVFGRWIEIEGPFGTEWLDAELVGQIEEYRGPAIPVAGDLSDFVENRMVTEIKIIEGWGARLSAPGFLDSTPWAVFENQEEAEEYLAEQQEDE